ncbi:hypothetical protein BA177_01050 [Woeseia oceani]|uniref:DUF932 domain-containing protein n=2 Tax=Woeseia oceani TaxID=1548547 RepID=A0A193LC70_9GAMM|nr:hypothetical protein BA177_01050 [Woeseia oceani]
MRNETMETDSAEVIPFDRSLVPGTQEATRPVSPFPDDSPLYFPVESRSVRVDDADGLPQSASGFKAIVRTDTNQVLGIHGRSYKVVPNEPLFRGFDEALQASDLDLSGLAIEDHVNYGGRRVIRNYRFPTVTAEPRIGDIVELRISVINSFDSGNAFTAQVGGMRLWCLNGAVSLQGTSSVYGRHTSGFDNNRALTKINKAIERYLVAATDWSEWSQRELTSLQVQTALEAFPDLNPTLLKRLEQAWTIESDHAGNTVWALYNAATRWSTHTPVRPSSEPNRASIVMDRERRVRQFMHSRAFKKLVA